MGLSDYSTEHSVGAYDIYTWADTSSVRTSKRATILDMMYAIKKKPVINILFVLHSTDLSQYLDFITTINSYSF